MMKKILAALMVMVMALLTAACGGAGDAPKEAAKGWL